MSAPLATDRVFSFPSTQAVRDQLKALDRALGFHMTPHLLRIAAISHLHENGADIRAIQEWAGHSKVDTTMRYIHTEATIMEQGQMVADALMAARGKITTKRLRKTLTGLAWR